MNRSIICTFILTTLAAHAPAYAQDNPPATPDTKDWFLSTGNWQNDPQLYVCEFGTGKDTVVMLHGGWGGSFDGLLSAVNNLGNQFHFIFYDQRGSLRSPFPDSLISFDQHIADIERLRTELGIEKLNLAGHSMGALLAGAYAEKYPAHIGRLVLLSPAMLKSKFAAEDRPMIDSAMEQFDKFLHRPAVESELKKYNLNRTSPPLSSREETMKFRILAFSRMVFNVSACQQVSGDRALFKSNVNELTEKTYPASGWDYVNAFGRQSYPVTIIAGDHDFVDFGNGLARKWCRDVPRIKLKVVKNAGHLLWLDNKTDFEKYFVAAFKK